jgi:hypothetical protein
MTLSSMARAVRSALHELGLNTPPLRYLAAHGAKVLKVASDALVDLAGDDENVAGAGGLTRRPILVGIPGARLDAPAGDRVRFAFVGGAEDGAEVIAYEQDRTADRPMARKGDFVQIGVLSLRKNKSELGEPPGMTITYTAQPSPYAPLPSLPKVLQILGSFQFVPDETFTIDLHGWITTGSPEISLRHQTTEEIP